MTIDAGDCDAISHVDIYVSSMVYFSTSAVRIGSIGALLGDEFYIPMSTKAEINSLDSCILLGSSTTSLLSGGLKIPIATHLTADANQIKFNGKVLALGNGVSIDVGSGLKVSTNLSGGVDLDLNLGPGLNLGADRTLYIMGGTGI